MIKTYFIASLLLICTSFCIAEDAEDKKSSRSFTFDYGATLEDLPRGSRVEIWIPVATSNEQQQITLQKTIAPKPLQIYKDAKYENSIGYIETTVEDTDQLEFKVSYDAVRKESKSLGIKDLLSDELKQRFLSANSLVPIQGEPVKLLKNVQLPKEPLAASRLIYDVVENHMKYDKSKPGYGKGDAVWACDSKTGNCTDFHSLFISIARSQSIPARFEIGFPLPNDKHEGTIGGYHCWAWFFTNDRGWSPVDISEADKHPEMKDYYFGRLTADRIAFSTGRDIELVPKSASGPLNYFIYPHIEVDGKPWPKNKVKLKFSFKDKPCDAS